MANDTDPACLIQEELRYQVQEDEEDYWNRLRDLYEYDEGGFCDGFPRV